MARSRSARSRRPEPASEPGSQAPARRSASSRRPASAGDGSSRRPSDRPRAAAAARERKPSGRASEPGPGRKPSSRPAAAGPGPGGRRSTRARLEAEDGLRRRSGGGSWLWILIVAVLAILIAGGLAIGPFLRAQKVAELVAAEPAEVPRIAREYVTLVDFDLQAIDALMVDGSLPPARALAVATATLTESAGTIAPTSAILGLVNDPQTPTADRVTGLDLLLECYHPERHADLYVTSDLRTWARPQGTVGPAEKALAAASHRFLAVLGHRGEPWNAPEILADIAREDLLDDTVRASAMTVLASLLGPHNALHGVNLLLGDDAARAAASGPLAEAIVASVTAEHLELLLRVWNHEVPAVAALATRAIAGPRVAIGNDEAGAALRERIGAGVAGGLDATILTERPERFAALLEVVAKLRLTGTRPAILALVPAVTDEGMRDTLALILGRSFIDSTSPAAKASSEETIAALAAGVALADRRSVCARALARLESASFSTIREAVAALAGHADDDDCNQALEHIVGRLLRRPDTLDTNGRDPGRWAAYLESGEVRYQRYREMVDWFRANQQTQRVSAGAAIIENRRTLATYMGELQAWLEDRSTPLPLGLTRGEVETFLGHMNTLNYALIKATAG